MMDFKLITLNDLWISAHQQTKENRMLAKTESENLYHCRNAWQTQASCLTYSAPQHPPLQTYI